MNKRRQFATDSSGATLGVAMVMGVVGLVLCALPPMAGWQRASFADRLARHAEASAGGVAQLEVRRLAERGIDALPALVRLAGSANADASAAARDAVENLLAGWETEFRSTGGAGTLGFRLRMVTGALEAGVGGFDAVGCAWARRIALQVAPHCDRLSAGDALVILASCDRVLAAKPAAVDSTVVATLARVTDAQSAAAPPPPRRRLLPTAPAVTPNAAVDEEISELTGALPSPANGDVQFVTPSPGLEVTAAAPITPPAPAPVATTDSNAAGVDSVEPLVAAPTPGVRPLPAPRFDPTLVDLPPPQRQRGLLRRFRVMSDRQLAAAMASAGTQEALMIEQVLRERAAATTMRGPRATAAGPRGTAALGRPAVQPQAGGGERVDGQDRLVDRVSRMPVAEARRLLRTLAADATADAETRLEALTLLATSGDPEVAAIARERALEDTDPRVAELAQKIMREGETRR